MTDREAIKQEPVAKWDASAPLVVHPHPAFQATPPLREWVGLTDEEQQAAYDAWQQEGDGWGTFYALIEAKLKEKNA